MIWYNITFKKMIYTWYYIIFLAMILIWYNIKKKMILATSGFFVPGPGPRVHCTVQRPHTAKFVPRQTCLVWKHHYIRPCQDVWTVKMSATWLCEKSLSYRPLRWQLYRSVAISRTIAKACCWRFTLKLSFAAANPSFSSHSNDWCSLLPSLIRSFLLLYQSGGSHSIWKPVKLIDSCA
jgi:hypothetical protein